MVARGGPVDREQGASCVPTPDAEDSKEDSPKEDAMRKVIFAVAAVALAGTALISTGSFAAPAGSSIRGAADEMAVAQDAAYIYGGRRHCWYACGWNGPGWY